MQPALKKIDELLKLLTSTLPQMGQSGIDEELQSTG